MTDEAWTRRANPAILRTTELSIWMLHDPARHEPLRPSAWSEARALEAIECIVRDAESHYSSSGWWPPHPRDEIPADAPAELATPLYFGAAGMVWALRHLRDSDAADLQRDRELPEPEDLLARNREWLRAAEVDDGEGSYFYGSTPILLMGHGPGADAALDPQLAALIEGRTAHPSRELMWGSPGTLLASLFLHRHTGDERWAALFRSTAAHLWSALTWSEAHRCAYWTQDLFGRRSTFLDALHGFVGTAGVIARGRHLLDDASWRRWRECISNTVLRTASWNGPCASWRAELLPGDPPSADKKRMQFCHGAPGFVVQLADLPESDLDDVLLAAGRATWEAGPPTKGSGLCHGTAGNGYALLKLFARTHDSLWLDRARAYAMHAIEQSKSDLARHGRLRYSLWTGDIGLAIFLRDCVRASPRFPTIDVFFAADPGGS